MGVVLIGPARCCCCVFLWPLPLTVVLSSHAQNLFTDLQPVPVGMLNLAAAWFLRCPLWQ